MHGAFSTLRQPNDEQAVNDIIDAYGFDFMQPLEVKWNVGTANNGLLEEAYLQITDFESHARIRGENRQGGIESFSMLMLDFDYNGETFDFDRAFYAHQLANTEWRAAFPLETIGERIMAVFLDIHGNESRIVIARSEFCASFVPPPSASANDL